MNCDTFGTSKNLVYELVAMIDQIVQENPEIKKKEKYEEFIEALLAEQLKLENLVAADLSGVEINLNCKNLFKNKFSKLPYYNKVLSVLQEILNGIQDKSIKLNMGNLIMLFKQVEFDECDSKTYLKLLKEITDVA